ncbi:class I SAM-dependent methyltransferase [Rivularia sp. UHCC 0363]|uniref:class I SAM-dependent methyltransferase n=1 Tax=Rivularia sp. UHCC 0363 TaxID=3110244 RepID=UPI002B1FD7AA|nr:methyltransferase domain-containing protein [Rivularia sp. UHCC 0363]MEA5596466.1 methyltransferase domain-containing protein [Rivularia sp. UHCC 0363]
MQSNFIKAWQEDGLIISSRYEDKIAADGMDSAKSLGERSNKKDFLFHSKLFQGITLNDNSSILDIGCGKGELLTFLNHHYPEAQIDKYLGLDIVAPFIDFARNHYPHYQFQLQNFASNKFFLDEPFDIVVALGVLVSRVRNYTEYVEYFIDKMLRCSSRQVLFNLISEVDISAENYINYIQVGHSTTFSKQVLESILDKFENITFTIMEEKIFSDATDMFIRIIK